MDFIIDIIVGGGGVEGYVRPHFYHPRICVVVMRSVASVCLSVCVSVCVYVCVCACAVRAVTFDSLDLETCLFICWPAHPRDI